MNMISLLHVIEVAYPCIYGGITLQGSIFFMLPNPLEVRIKLARKEKCKCENKLK